MESTLLFVVVLALAAFIVWLVVSGSSAEKDLKQRLQELTSPIGLALPTQGSDERGQHSGHDYRYGYVVSRNRVSVAHVSIAHRNKGHLTVRREHGFDRWVKRLGIAVEVQTGDRAFDDTYFIESGEPVFARAMLSQENVRSAIARLFDGGFGQVALDDENVRAELSQNMVVRNRKFHLHDAVEALGVLINNQPNVPEHLGSDRRKAWTAKLAIVYSLLATAFFTGWMCLIFDLQLNQPLDKKLVFDASLPATYAAIGIGVVLLYFLLKGHSTSHRHLTLSVLILVLSTPVLSYYGTIVVNSIQDTSPAEVLELPVVQKRNTSGKNVRYYVSVPSWRDGNTIEELRLDSNLYWQIEPGRTGLKIVARQGHLGFPWIESLSPIKHFTTEPDAATAPRGLRRYP